MVKLGIGSKSSLLTATLSLRFLYQVMLVQEFLLTDTEYISYIYQRAYCNHVFMIESLFSNLFDINGSLSLQACNNSNNSSINISSSSHHSLSTYPGLSINLESLCAPNS